MGKWSDETAAALAREWGSDPQGEHRCPVCGSVVTGGGYNDEQYLEDGSIMVSERLECDGCDEAIEASVRFVMAPGVEWERA